MATLKPVDERFFSTAPLRYSHTWTIPKPAEEVWADLVADKPLQCIPRLTLRWTSPRPLSVGATRRATCMGILKLDENFFIWDEGRRYTFYIFKSNLPLYRSFAEDYRVEPLRADRCQFTFRAAGDPTFVGRLGGRSSGGSSATRLTPSGDTSTRCPPRSTVHHNPTKPDPADSCRAAHRSVMFGGELAPAAPRRFAPLSVLLFKQRCRLGAAPAWREHAPLSRTSALSHGDGEPHRRRSHVA